MIAVFCLMACFVASVILIKLGFDDNNIYKFWGGVFLSPLLLIYNYFVLTTDVRVKSIDYYPVINYVENHRHIPYYKVKDEVILLSEMDLEIPDYADSKKEYKVKITKYDSFYYLIYIDIKDKYEIE